MVDRRTHYFLNILFNCHFNVFPSADLTFWVISFVNELISMGTSALGPEIVTGSGWVQNNLEADHAKCLFYTICRVVMNSTSELSATENVDLKIKRW